MQALQDGVEITTMTCFGKLGITTCSQRGGALARMGLVTREHVEVLNHDGKPVKVVRLNLTEAGRTINLDPARPEMAATASEAQASYSAPERQEQPCNSGRRVILPEEDLLSVR